MAGSAGSLSSSVSLSSSSSMGLQTLDPLSGYYASNSSPVRLELHVLVGLVQKPDQPVDLVSCVLPKLADRSEQLLRVESIGRLIESWGFSKAVMAAIPRTTKLSGYASFFGFQLGIADAAERAAWSRSDGAA
jgi:hypothetical protein